MQQIADPDLGSNKMRVTECTACFCKTPSHIILTGHMVLTTKIVPAEIVEEGCPDCHGSGKVKVKRPKETEALPFIGYGFR